MMDVTKTHSFNSFVRMMYACSTPEIARHDGWLKTGDTEQGDACIDYAERKDCAAKLNFFEIFKQRTGWSEEEVRKNVKVI